jgi:hypothetical protein
MERKRIRVSLPKAMRKLLGLVLTGSVLVLAVEARPAIAAGTTSSTCVRKAPCPVRTPVPPVPMQKR